MGLLSAFKQLFSSEKNTTKDSQQTEEYQGYTITPTPRKEGSQYRVCAVISKGEQTHTLIRADLLGSESECVTETLRKAKMTIDQLGDGIFV